MIESDRGIAGQLITKLVEGGDADGEVAENLLEAFWQGYDVANLSPLLRSDDNRVQFWAAYILKELGKRAETIVADTVELISHPSEELRSSAIENLLSCYEKAGAVAAGRIVARYTLENARIRREIINYVARMPLAVLQDGIATIDDAMLHERHTRGVRILVDAGIGTEGEILSCLTSNDELLRAYAVAAAIRIYLLSRSILKTAKKSLDPTVAAESEIWYGSIVER